MCAPFYTQMKMRVRASCDAVNNGAYCAYAYATAEVKTTHPMNNERCGEQKKGYTRREILIQCPCTSAHGVTLTDPNAPVASFNDVYLLRTDLTVTNMSFNTSSCQPRTCKRDSNSATLSSAVIKRVLNHPLVTSDDTNLAFRTAIFSLHFVVRTACL